jgi:hypothetical protein
LSSASINAAAVAELLPWAMKPMPWSVAERSSDSAFSVWPSLSKRTISSRGAPRRCVLTRSLAHSRLRNTASPAFANGPDSPSISAMRTAGAALCATAVPQAAPAAQASARRRDSPIDPP